MRKTYVWDVFTLPVYTNVFRWNWKNRQYIFQSITTKKFKCVCTCKLFNVHGQCVVDYVKMWYRSMRSHCRRCDNITKRKNTRRTHLKFELGTMAKNMGKWVRQYKIHIRYFWIYELNVSVCVHSSLFISSIWMAVCNRICIWRGCFYLEFSINVNHFQTSIVDFSN